MIYRAGLNSKNSIFTVT